MPHVIAGTAGHIDHGKTALVKALTGIDADRMKEEKQRGITIDIGLGPTPADAILFKQMPSKFEAVPGVLSSTLLVNYGLLGGNSAGLRINHVEGYVPRDDEDMEIAHFSVEL